jgi:queuine tRNA-ribosyltransferase
MLSFAISHTDGAARRGRLTLPHGVVDTPQFMPVGTVASVKALAPDDLTAIGAQIILGNTYHLMLRPGAELIEELGGLHRFMSWGGAVLTDSGGYQVYSLAAQRKLTEEGALFSSHLDGSRHLLTPERAVEIQGQLGSDILMCLDECPPAQSDERHHVAALERTTRWAQRCKRTWLDRLALADALGPAGARGPGYRAGSLFGIVQGGLFPHLRARHAEEIAALDLPGTALGGFSVGEAPPVMWEGVAHAALLLPAHKPRYLMGVGTPEDLLRCALSGIDLFDCVMPTRVARNGLLFTRQGRLQIKAARYARDQRPADEECRCYACRTFTRAYLRHLFASRELLALRLNSLHNLAFYLDLTAGLRAAIERREARAWVDAQLARFKQGPD